MSDLRCAGASCAYGEVVAVEALDLHIADGETVALVGGPASGKTTVVRMIAGIEPLTSGRIEIGGADVTALPPARRGLAVVFANATPSARLTIADHLRLVASDERAATEAASAMELDGLSRRIRRLSQLERQLVAVARGLATRPRVLLLDDPTAGLAAGEAATFRERVRALPCTTLYTTRDAAEGAAVADRVAVLSGGRLAEVAPPADLRDRPTTVQAARELDPGLVVRTVQPTGWPYPSPPAEAFAVALRPDAARLDPSGELTGTALAARGPTVFVALAGWDEPLPVRIDGAGLEFVGHRVRVRLDLGAVQLFPLPR